MKLTIKWNKKATPDIRERIQKRFNLPSYITINWETPGEFSEDDLPDLERVADLGIKIRRK